MEMLLDGILVLSSLAARDRGWYCIESIAIDRARVDHTDLEVSMRVRFPQGITQTIVCYRGLLGSQRLTGLLGYPVTLSKIIRLSEEAPLEDTGRPKLEKTIRRGSFRGHGEA